MDLGGLVGGALALDPDAFEGLARRPDALRVALWVAFLAGLSSEIGQSVGLFASRVPPRRFAASLLLSAGLFVGVFVAWAASMWLVARVGFGIDLPFREAVEVTGLAYVPHLFGVFVLVPYLGSAIGALLSIWNLLAITVAASAVFDLALVEAVACTGGGWVVLHLVQRTLGWPLARVVRALRAVVAGRPLEGLDRLGRPGGGET